MVIAQVPDDGGDHVMTLVVVRPSAFECQIVKVLGAAVGARAVHLGTGQGLAKCVEAADAEVLAHGLLDVDLQRVVGSGAVGLHDIDGGELAPSSGPPAVDVGSRGSGAAEGIVDVGRERQVMAESADVSRRHGESARDLPLDGEVELIAERPLEVESDGQQTGGKNELGVARRIEIREGRDAAGQAGIRMGEGRHRGELLADGEGL